MDASKRVSHDGEPSAVLPLFVLPALAAFRLSGVVLLPMAKGSLTERAS
jgi:hypothetical protein